MHDHLKQGNGGDSDIFKVVRIRSPWLCVLDLFLFGGIVSVKSITVTVNKLDIIIELCWLELEWSLQQYVAYQAYPKSSGPNS